MSLDIYIEDEVASRFFREELGKLGPYTAEEVSSVDPVSLKYASGDLSFLRHWKDGFVLGISCSELTDISWWPTSETLGHVGLQTCPVRDISPLTRCPNITTFELAHTLVEDLRPLLTYEYLDKVNVRGCPLSEESFFEILPELKEKPRRHLAKPPHVWHCDEEAWRLSVELRDRGLRAVYTENQRHEKMVIAPGLLANDTPDLYAYRLTPDELRAVLDAQEWELKPFMARCREIAHARF